MKNIRKNFITTILAIAVIFISADTTVFAAEKMMEDGTIFDAQFYAERYPDVVAAKGYSEGAMWEHYKEFGRREGRFPHAGAEPQDISFDDDICNRIMAMQSEFPEGMEWDFDNVYSSPNRNREVNSTLSQCSACQAFAYIVLDRVFGTEVHVAYKDCGFVEWASKRYTTPGTHVIDVSEYLAENPQLDACKNTYWNNLRSGDLLQYGDHIVVVLRKSGNNVIVAEGNFNGRIHWGREISKDFLMSLPLFCVETVQW